MRKCSACGAEINDDSRFCEYCGSPLVINGNSVNQNNVKPNMNNNVLNNNNIQHNMNINNNGVNQNNVQPNMNVNNINNTNNVKVQNQVGEFTIEDIENNKVMAILCYLFPIVPYLAEKDSKWVRFHAIQGMNLWIYGIILTVILTIITTIFSIIPFIGGIISALVGLLLFVVSIGSFALDIIGIVNVCKMQAKPLPIIDKIKILKK